MGYRCFQCGHELRIDDNWMGSDLGLVSSERELSDSDFMVTLMCCPYCGLSYEVAECPLEDRKDYEYYNETNDAN